MNEDSISNILDKIINSMSYDKPSLDLIPFPTNSSEGRLSKYQPNYLGYKKLTNSPTECPIAYDISEDTFDIQVLLPLVNRSSLAISLENTNKLSIKAEYFDIFTKENQIFDYIVNIPKTYPVDRTEKVKASYTDGVLTISIPLIPKQIINIYLEESNN